MSHQGQIKLGFQKLAGEINLINGKLPDLTDVNPVGSIFNQVAQPIASFKGGTINESLTVLKPSNTFNDIGEVTEIRWQYQGEASQTTFKVTSNNLQGNTIATFDSTTPTGGGINSPVAPLELKETVTGFDPLPEGFIFTNEAADQFSFEVVKEDELAYWAFWGEDSGNTSANGYIYSWGNGDTGIIGVPIIGTGNQITGLAFQADNGGIGDSVEIRVVDAQDISNIVILTTLSVVGAGDGVDNNTHFRQEFDTPIDVPDGAVLVFQTGAESGVYNGHRAFVFGQKPTGRQIVTDLKFTPPS